MFWLWARAMLLTSTNITGANSPTARSPAPAQNGQELPLGMLAHDSCLRTLETVLVDDQITAFRRTVRQPRIETKVLP